MLSILSIPGMSVSKIITKTTDCFYINVEMQVKVKHDLKKVSN